MPQQNETNLHRQIMGVLYLRQDPLLYGFISFYKWREGDGTVLPYKKSSPFVVSETTAPGEELVYGSVVQLVRNLQRLLRTIDHKVDQHATEMLRIMENKNESNFGRTERADMLLEIPGTEIARRAHLDFTIQLTDTLILLSTQARNLFDLFPRLKNDRELPLSDHDDVVCGKIRVADLLNHFVHNRYLFLDGEHVSNLFPGKPRKSPINDTFMGYRFNWIDYIESLKRAIEDVRMRDMTCLLRKSLDMLSLETPYADVIFLVQNVYAFSRLLGNKVIDDRYSFMLNVLFGDELQSRATQSGSSDDALQVACEFRTPVIGIHHELSRKAFQIRAQRRWSIRTKDGGLQHSDSEFNESVVKVGYEQFLNQVDASFGDDLLLHLVDE